MSEEYLTTDGLKELEKQDLINHGAVLATAILFAAKEGRKDVDDVYIKKAARSVSRISQNSGAKLILAVTTIVLLGLAFFQMGLVGTSSSFSSQVSLWVLPVFSIVWTITN